MPSGAELFVQSIRELGISRIFTLPYLVIAIGHLLPRRLWLPNWLTVANYGVYLYGFVVSQTLLFLGMRTPWLLAVTAVPIALACGLVSWHLVEKRAMKLRRFLIRRRKPAGRDAESEPTEELPKVGAPQPAPATG